LLIEDDPSDARRIQGMLADAVPPPFSVSHETELAPALQRLDNEPFDAIVCALSLPDVRQTEALARLRNQAGRVPVVALTGPADLEVALEAVRQGTQQYLVKGQLNGSLVLQAICYAVERKQIEEVLTRSRDELVQRVEERTVQLDAANQALLSEKAERKRIEQALHDLNDSLEQRVLARTGQLTEAHARLTEEVGERKQMESELLRRNRELLSVQAAVAATGASLDLQFVLDTVTWEMANLLEADSCTIFEWDPEANRLSLMAQYPPPDNDQPELATGVDLAGYELRHRVLAEKRVHQVGLSQADRDPAEWARMQRMSVKSLLMMPMVFQERVIGLLETRCQVERLFTDYEISMAQVLATQAASAIENARLYERAQIEIAKRREAEERIKTSLHEKEVLLREIHHRVKNNLQVVSSLLYLQSESIADPRLLGALQDSQNRVRSMALVHERLYQTEDLARINFPGYIRDLAGHLLSSYNSGAHHVELTIDADDVSLDVDTAVPCGLIINELISNSLKHAFAGRLRKDAGDTAAGETNSEDQDSAGNGRKDEIRIEVRTGQDGQLALTVGDNGVGFPESIDFRNSPSLGLLLVNSLVRQLRGTIELDGQGGTQFRIVFSLPDQRGPSDRRSKRPSR
jgi:two-component sensor histidine kinase/CheY-like chemotaxis protein